MRLIGFLGISLLAACATDPQKIQAAYVSPIQYQGYTCQQIAGELGRVTRKATEVGGGLKKLADDDESQMAIGLILFWPALFFLEGSDGPQATEYARLKGERDALEQVAIKKDCGIEVKPIEIKKKPDTETS